MPGIRVKDQTEKGKVLLVLLSVWKLLIQGFQGLCASNWGQIHSLKPRVKEFCLPSFWWLLQVWAFEFESLIHLKHCICFKNSKLHKENHMYLFYSWRQLMKNITFLSLKQHNLIFYYSKSSSANVRLPSNYISTRELLSKAFHFNWKCRFHYRTFKIFECHLALSNLSWLKKIKPRHKINVSYINVDTK